MQTRKLIFVIWTLIAMLFGFIVFATLQSVNAQGSCDVSGKTIVVVEAGQLNTTQEIDLGDDCPNPEVVMVSGGSNLNVPVIINGRMAQGILVVSVWLQANTKGPVDVKVYYRVSN